MTDTPRIYVACLSAYNNGHLHGRWIDADQDADAIWDEINAMLAASPMDDAEEHAIHDHEGFGRSSVGEYTSIETITELAEFIGEHGDLGTKVLDHFSGDLSEAQKAMDNYAGEHKSLADFAAELTEESREIPDYLQYYIDWEAMGRDMEINGDVFTVETGFEEVHIFWGG